MAAKLLKVVTHFFVFLEVTVMNFVTTEFVHK
jgi:hypothetical protein